MTKTQKCGCKNEYQDQKYGKGFRLMNSLQKPAKPHQILGYRCTVCGMVYNL